MPNSVEVKIRLPKPVMERLEEVAADRQTLPELAAVDWLDATLPPSRKRIRAKIDELQRRIAAMTDEELETKLNAQLSPDQQDRLSWLLEGNQDASLSGPEVHEMRSLVARTEEMGLERAAAFGELRNRGKNPRLEPPSRQQLTSQS